RTDVGRWRRVVAARYLSRSPVAAHGTEPTISDAARPHGAHASPTRCENCDTPLQGEFCHQCGQSIHNPIRHAAHAVEEFFEAFWHLDGRLWRTLRDLASPGRTAINYLAGHRQRYIAPLRL